MQTLHSAVLWLSEHIRPYSFQVATAIVATLLFIYGESVTRRIRDRLRGKPFVIRVTIFIAVCAFGFGAFSVALAAILARLFLQLPLVLLTPTILLAFVVIGTLAERRRQI